MYIWNRLYYGMFFYHRWTQILYSKILWIIIGIIVLCAILILLGYFIGKYLNKARKKRANELLDDFDYIQDNKDENNKNINNAIVDDDKNIN